MFCYMAWGAEVFFTVIFGQGCIDCTMSHFSTLRKERAKTVAGARSLKHACSRE